MFLLQHLLILSIALLHCTNALLAFPGAEGFGRNAIGGRKGSAYIVNNLNDSGSGSLRDALSNPDRMIIFAVDGLIKIKQRMVVSKRLSILGQTAPGDGITIYGNGWSFSNADDAIVRYIRIRMGKHGTRDKDGITIDRKRLHHDLSSTTSAPPRAAKRVDTDRDRVLDREEERLGFKRGRSNAVEDKNRDRYINIEK